MTEVGYNGDPMRGTAIAGGDLENNEVPFTPGSGVAAFDRLVFNEAGRFNLVIQLSYTAMANVTVQSVSTISFDVTADVPERIEVSQPGFEILGSHHLNRSIIILECETRSCIVIG